MYKRYAKYVDRSGDLAGDEALQDSIYVPETLVATAVDDLNNNDDEGPYECSLCVGKVMATMADVRKHIAGKFHKQMEEGGTTGSGAAPNGEGKKKRKKRKKLVDDAADVTAPADADGDKSLKLSRAGDASAPTLAAQRLGSKQSALKKKHGRK